MSGFLRRAYAGSQDVEKRQSRAFREAATQKRKAERQTLKLLDQQARLEKQAIKYGKKISDAKTSIKINEGKLSGVDEAMRKVNDELDEQQLLEQRAEEVMEGARRESLRLAVKNQIDRKREQIREIAESSAPLGANRARRMMELQRNTLNGRNRNLLDAVGRRA